MADKVMTYMFNTDSYIYYYSRPSDTKKLDSWTFLNRNTKKIIELTKKELMKAIIQIQSGGPCFGQDSKIISLRKELLRRSYPQLEVTKGNK